MSRATGSVLMVSAFRLDVTPADRLKSPAAARTCTVSVIPLMASCAFSVWVLAMSTRSWRVWVSNPEISTINR